MQTGMMSNQSFPLAGRGGESEGETRDTVSNTSNSPSVPCALISLTTLFLTKIRLLLGNTSKQLDKVIRFLSTRPPDSSVSLLRCCPHLYLSPYLKKPSHASQLKTLNIPVMPNITYNVTQHNPTQHNNVRDLRPERRCSNKWQFVLPMIICAVNHFT